MYLNPHTSVQTAPAITPVSVAEVKDNANVDSWVDDPFIGHLIDEVVGEIDGPHGWLGRALITQSLRLTIDAFPSSRRIYLPCPPLQSVSSVRYLDLDEVEQTLASADYRVVTDAEPGYIELDPEKTWPETRDVGGAVWIDYDAGYGDAASDVPQRIRGYIAIFATERYEHRNAVNIGATVTAFPHVRHMIDNYRVKLAAVSDDHKMRRWRAIR